MIINGFELKSLIGKGGMAEVWYAENNIGKKAAVKILLPKYCRDETVIARFQKEAKIMVNLEHGNIRQVYSSGIIKDRPCIIMEYLEGNDLKSRLREGERFDDAELIKWWNQLADALNYTHQKGVIHRDIKPSNIFIDGKRNAKLIDFGIAKEEGSDSLTLTGALLGTILYMSPEQIRGTNKNIDYRTDLYSLAVTFVHLITGNAPYDVTTNDDLAIRQSIAEKKLDLSGVPKKWRKFLAPYLEKDPQNRPALTHFKMEQEVLLHDDTLLGIQDSSSSNAGGERKRKDGIKKYVKIGIIAMVAVVLMITLVLWLRPKLKDEDTLRFLSCKVVNDYRLYLKDFPDGKHFEEASQFINTFVADSIAHAQLVFTVNGVSFTMKYVEGGSFMMGGEEVEVGDDKRPGHRVEVEDFYIGETEVTQALWKAVMGNSNNPSSFKGDSLPVESVSWDDCHVFIRKLNEKIQQTNTTINGIFRLPFESEWEYAARGGKNSRGYIYSGSNLAKDVAWYRVNSESATHKVGGKAPNELGIYDLSGNVWEWCEDNFGYQDENGNARSRPLYKVLRGGSWYYDSIACRVSARSKSLQNERLESGGMRFVLSNSLVNDSQYKLQNPTDNTEIVQPIQGSRTAQKRDSMDLGFGKWYGGQKNGRPDGKGMLEMTKKHSFGGQTIEAGTVMKDVLFENGVFVMGKICDDDGRPIKTILP